MWVSHKCTGEGEGLPAAELGLAPARGAPASLWSPPLSSCAGLWLRGRAGPLAFGMLLPLPRWRAKTSDIWAGNPRRRWGRSLPAPVALTARRGRAGRCAGPETRPGAAACQSGRSPGEAFCALFNTCVSWQVAAFGWDEPLLAGGERAARWRRAQAGTCPCSCPRSRLLPHPEMPPGPGPNSASLLSVSSFSALNGRTCRKLRN